MLVRAALPSARGLSGLGQWGAVAAAVAGAAATAYAAKQAASAKKAEAKAQLKAAKAAIKADKEAKAAQDKAAAAAAASFDPMALGPSGPIIPINEAPPTGGAPAWLLPAAIVAAAFLFRR
jgi:hypothetical protein